MYATQHGEEAVWGRRCHESGCCGRAQQEATGPFSCAQPVHPDPRLGTVRTQERAGESCPAERVKRVRAGQDSPRRGAAGRLSKAELTSSAPGRRATEASRRGQLRPHDDGGPAPRGDRPGVLPGTGGGGYEIRTREGLPPTRFPSVRPRPLGESSVGNSTRRRGVGANSIGGDRIG